MKIRSEFKEFLFKEEEGSDQEFFGQKVGAILTAIQDLVENGEGVGTRQLMKSSEMIVGQIRTVLHSRWSSRELDGLRVLQKVGVAIKGAIEERSDLLDILRSSQFEIEKMSEKLGIPLNRL